MGPKPTADKKVKKCLNLFDHGGLVGLGGLGEREIVLQNLENLEEK